MQFKVTIILSLALYLYADPHNGIRVRIIVIEHACRLQISYKALV